jgi:hypothetical protein
MRIEAFALYWFVMFPASLLCLQYGWDMIVYDLIHVEDDNGGDIPA